MMQILRTIKDVNTIVPKVGMRGIKYVFYHCTAGPQSQTTQEIFNYWKNHNGWSKPGYHFDINPDGTIEQYVEIWDISNGVLNYNSNAIHICYKGGISPEGKPLDNRTGAQKTSQILLMNRMKKLFPNAIHLGHRDISLDKNGNGILESWEWIKACPAYDFRTWAMLVGKNEIITPEKIVYKLHDPAIKNETVVAIQMALGIKQDGFFGEQTDQAVRGFQTKNGLISDGVVGEATAAKLLPWLDKPQYAVLRDLLREIKNN